MIYLFCNELYGKPFLDVAREYFGTHKTDVCIVFSDKRGGSQRTLRDMALRLFRVYRRQRRRSVLSHSLKMPVLIVQNVNSPLFRRRILPNDHGIIAGFNQIFDAQTIRKFGSLVNFHPSLLPLYRGPVPSYWCIRNGEERTGYTLHKVTPKIDKGEVLFQEEIPINGILSSLSLDQKIARRAALCFREYLEHLERGTQWIKVELDARRIYKKHVNYASLPSTKGD